MPTGLGEFANASLLGIKQARIPKRSPLKCSVKIDPGAIRWVRFLPIYWHKGLGTLTNRLQPRRRAGPPIRLSKGDQNQFPENPPRIGRNPTRPNWRCFRCHVWILQYFTYVLYVLHAY